VDNPLVRRPIDLATYRNRRKLVLAPAPEPQPKNTRNVDTRRDAMNALVGWVTLAIVTLGGTAGVSYAAFKVNASTAGLELELAIGFIGSVAIMIGLWSIKKAYTEWRMVWALDEKSRVRNQLLANIARPVEDKLQLPFTNWLE
jgi:hypothetical protein